MESSRIFVKGLPPTVTEADLRKHFGAKGHITDVKAIPNRRIGYVGFKSPQEATNAVKHFNRSFIRMSRISVELARPVADPSLSKTKPAENEQHNAELTDQSIKPILPSDAKTENAKKRKREDLDESDPRLQQFLGVMQPTKNSANRIHESEGQPIEEPPTKIAAIAVEEDGSDDEYEAVPSRNKKVTNKETRKVNNALADTTSPPFGNERVETITHSSGNEPAQTADRAAGVTNAGPVAAGDDDDWLRQKTNRLLDLVDDEDDISTAVHAKRLPSESHIPEEDHDMVDEPEDHDLQSPPATDNKPQAEANEVSDAVRKTSRLFIRNLPFTATEDDVRSHFAQYGAIEEVHVPTDSSKNNRGMGFVLFTNPDDANKAFQADRSSFQGRILHVLPATAKRDHDLDEFALSKLPLKQQNLIKKRAKAATSRFNWNSLYMSQDAVNASVADRLKISKSELLDPTSSDAAVKQAIAETSTIQDTKSYFSANGVDLNAFKSGARGDIAILVKNFPYGTTIEKIRSLFEEHGQVVRVLMPPAGTIAIVQFAQASQAKGAFAKLAYRRLKDSILFLEKAPRDLFIDQEQHHQVTKGEEPTGVQKLSVSELLERDNKEDPVEASSLFVKNLHWDTTTAELAAAFQHLEGFRSAQVKTKKDPNKPGQVLSMGFGFVSFTNKASAEAALKVMDGHALRAHKLQVRASHRGHDAAEERRKEDNAKKVAGQRTKIVIKNVPFQANKRDIRLLLSTYGQLKSVRIPKKYNSSSKGFAFAEFVSPKEAESALLALQDTHLLGRRLILEYAEAETVDPELEIAKMQKKVGGQANKVALQQLTGGGRKKVTLGTDEDEGEI